MARSSVVHDYEHPQNGTTPTFTIDEKIQHSIAQSGIERPKGYTVSYHANPEAERHHFGQTHPMKPWRLTLTNKIVFAYGMHYAMDMYLARAATHNELTAFHSEDYIDFLQSVTPVNAQTDAFAHGTTAYNIGDDCPIFDGLYTYSSLYAGASLDAARKLTSHQSQIAINLVRRFTPRQKVRSIRLLLHQRHRARHPPTTAAPPARALHRHRRAPR